MHDPYEFPCDDTDDQKVHTKYNSVGRCNSFIIENNLWVLVCQDGIIRILPPGCFLVDSYQT